MSLARRSLQVVAFVCTLVVGVAAMAAIVTQTAWFKEWLRGFIVRQAEDYVNGRLSIGRLDGNLFFGVELEDVDVTMNGKTVVDIHDIGLDYNAFSFIGGDVVLDDIRLNRPVLRLERTAGGWNLAELVKVRTPDPDEPKSRRTIEIGEIGVSDGTLHIEPQAVGTSGIDTPSRIDRLNASVGVRSNEDELSIDIAHVSLRAAEPGFGLNAMSGVIRRTENEVTLDNVSMRTEESTLRVAGTIQNIEGGTQIVDLKASSDKLALDEIAKLVPALRGYEMQPAFEITARGPMDRMAVDLSAREANLGQMSGDLTVNTLEPGRRVAGTVSLQHFNFGPLVRREAPAGARDTLRSDITGEAQIDLALPTEQRPLSGNFTINAEQVQVAGYEARNVVANGRIDGSTIRVDANATAYGGRATAAGTVRTGEQLALDIRGHASDIDLRNLPPTLNAPRMASNIEADYTLTGRGPVFSGDVRFETSTIANATIEAGTTARFNVGAGAPSYAAKGQVANLDLQAIGRGLEISALANDRYRSRVNATFDMTGTGGGRYPLTLEANGTVVDSELFGATFPRMDFTTNVAGGDLRVRANGEFAGLDPAVVAENEKVAGKVTGTVDVEAAIRQYAEGVTADSIDATGRVTLGNSTIAGLVIDSANVDGRYANREGVLNQATITGPDVNVSAQGPIALNETGASNLVVHAESAVLARIGEIVGQPLKGAAIVDATVTGNGTSLQAQGKLKGSNIGHGENEALSLTSDFAVSITDLNAEQAVIQANSAATFLEIGGLRITELTADTRYSQSRLEFKAVAQEDVRELAAGGSVLFHPDHQEVHVSDLSLRSEQIEWRSAPESEATIQYGRDRVEVKNLQLVSADQQINADGVFGSPGESLRVRVANVDMGQLDQLLLSDQRLAGRLNADAIVSGTTKEPRVEGEFTLAQGAFRMFMFESLTGRLDYERGGINVDVRLQQTPAAWLTAKGFAPMTLFRANPSDVESAHVEPSPGEAVDLQIASSEVDLGVIQGFTSYVTNVTGSVQANVTVTGSGYDPHVNGAIDIRGGAFAIPEFGTNYTGLDTRVELQPDQVSIREFKILDNRGFPMSVGGTLAMHSRSVGAVNINVQSENFEVIDNELADLKLDTQIQITGELRKPRIQGLIEVENGTIHIAQLLERVTADPYAVDAAPIQQTSGADEAAKAVATEARANGQPGASAERQTSGADEAAKAVAAEAQANGQAEASAEQQTSVFDALDLEVALAVPSNLVVRGNDIRPANAPIEFGDMNVTVGGALQLRKTPGSMLRLDGEVNTVRGNYTFQGRRFEILRDGRIRFIGTDEIDPTLDIRARRIISGVETFIRVQGTMRQPELAFSSNPPLDQADILSLIVFNQPINELGEGQQVSLAERAGALAGGYLASGLARSIGSALELDEFEIQAQGEGGGPSLSVGEQVGEKLFFRVRQGFGDAQATELILEYQIADFLRLQATGAETAGGAQRVTFRRVERGGLDLIFFFSY